MLQPGTIINNTYQIEQQIGSGGVAGNRNHAAYRVSCLEAPDCGFCQEGTINRCIGKGIRIYEKSYLRMPLL